MENSNCEYRVPDILNAIESVKDRSPKSPFRAWIILAIMAVLRCATPNLSQPVHAPMPQGTDPLSPGAKVPKPGLYDGIKRVCGKARIPIVGEIAARLPDLQERQNAHGGLMGGVTIYTDLPPNRGDGSPDDYSYSTVCFSERPGEPALPIRKFIVSRRKGPTAADLLEQWHVYDGRVMTDRQREVFFPEKYSDMRPGCGLEIPGMGCLGAGWREHEQFEHCPQEDYADLFDTPLCPTIEDVEELNQ